jgi:hypothetical protein
MFLCPGKHNILTQQIDVFILNGAEHFKMQGVYLTKRV